MSAETGQDFALRMYTMFKGASNVDYIKAAARDYNASRHEVLMLLYAGWVYAHALLGPLVIGLGLRPATVYEFAILARKCKGSWKNPGVGKIKESQLDLLAELSRGIDFSNINRGLCILRGAVKQHNTDFEMFEQARVEQEYCQRKEQGIVLEHPVVNLDDIAQNNAPAAVDCENNDAGDFPEPKEFWDKSELRATFRKDRTGYNTLTLKGIADADVLVLKNCIRRLYGTLPDPVRKAPKEARDGHSLYRILLEQIRRGEDTAKIRLNFVCNLDTLLTHPEWSLTCEGKQYDAVQVHDLILQWGEDQRLLVTDLKGRVKSISNSRFATEAVRMIWRVQTNRCVVPGCNEQACLEFHHLVDYKDLPRTNLEDVRPVCQRHHKMLTNGQATLELFDDLQTAAWYEDNHLRVDVAAHPTGTLFQALGREYGLDTLVPEEFQRLRKILKAKTWARINSRSKQAG